MRLKDKIALVTGAARGIGEAIARRFAEEGASLVLGDLNTEGVAQVAKAISNQGGKVIRTCVNVTDRQDVRRLVQEAVGHFGTVHILVNNAAIFSKKPFTEVTDEDWDSVLAVDLKGVFNCTQAVLGHMIKQNYGKIINISSALGTGVSGAEDFVSYSVAKGGVIQLTKITARVGGPYGINANCIAPGAVATRILYDTLGTKEAVEKFLEAKQRLSVLGCVIEPVDIANAALFLASDDSRCTTGQVIYVDGGRSDRM
jgi:3-oxoacyl-[acyl-carrier protein] reductase